MGRKKNVYMGWKTVEQIIKEDAAEIRKNQGKPPKRSKIQEENK